MKGSADRRAARLALLYPRRWRREYPDFVGVLAAELDEHPWRSRTDVIRAAIIERARAAGIIPTGPDDRARSGLALIYATLLPFTALVAGIWSQLRTGIGTHGRDTPPVVRAADLLLAFGTVAVFVSLAVVVPLVAAHSRGRSPDSGPKAGLSARGLLRPALILVGSIATLTAAGWAADRSGWYSPAAAALPKGGLGYPIALWARGAIAAITPAWVHPTMFGHMPTGELLASLVAPFAALAGALALLRLVGRLPLRKPGRTDIALALTIAGMMLISVAASVRWVLAHPTREGTSQLLARTDQLAPGHTGWGVAFLLLVLAGIAMIGTRRVLQGRRQPTEPGSGTSLDPDVGWVPESDGSGTGGLLALVLVEP
ncbi:MAG TPA: hypothetical protein VII76_13040 [Acidimicrobiales bacterium]